MHTKNTTIRYKQCRLSLNTHKQLRLIGAELDLTVTQVVDLLIDSTGKGKLIKGGANE